MAGFAVPSRERWAHALKLAAVIGSEPTIVAWAEPGPAGQRGQRDRRTARGQRPHEDAVVHLVGRRPSVAGRRTSSRDPRRPAAPARR